ncbi:hypothetical protein D3C81_1901070 [compost metagenome]
MTAALVPALKRFTAHADQAQAPAGIDAIDLERFAREAVDGGQVGVDTEQPRVPLRDPSSGGVMPLSGNQGVQWPADEVAQVRHLTDR